MRRTLAIICFLAGISTAPIFVHAQGLEAAQQEFVNVFLAVRKGEEQEKSGDTKAALATYRAAVTALKRIKQDYPNWQAELLDFRLKRTVEAVDRLQGKMGDSAPGTGSNDPGLLPPLPLDDPLRNEPAPGKPKTPAPAARKGGTAKEPAGDDVFDAVKQRLATLETRLAEANEKLLEEQQKNAQLTKDMGEAMDARKKAEDARKKAQDLAEVYQKTMLELKAKGDASSERVKDLEVKLADVKRRNVDTEAELASAEERISQLIGRSRAMAAKAGEAATLPSELKKLQAKLDEEQKSSASQALEARKREEGLKTQIAALTKDRNDAAKLPAEVKELQAKLASEQRATAAAAAKSMMLEEDLKRQIAVLTKDRNDARAELVRLKELNTQTDRLLADNASLLKKLGDAEKQILSFRSDSASRETDIAALKKQVTDTQKALTVSAAKSTTMQAEIGELQKKVTDYSKQIAQFKADKTASLEERRKMEDENKLLQGIVMRVLQEDANRAQRKKMIQNEVGRLQIQSDVLLQQINYLTQPVVKLSTAERRLFKKPVFDVQDPNALVAIKTDALIGAEPPRQPVEPAPVKPSAGDPVGTPPPPAPEPSKNPPPPTAATEPKPETEPVKPVEMAKLDPPKTDVKPSPAEDLPKKDPADTKPVEMAKLDPPKTELTPKPPGDLPSKDPADTKPPEIGQTPTVSNIAGAKLPAEVKPIAEQAKQAFEREKFTDAEKLYEKALQLAPNNVYLLSNRAVVQFRMQKYKQAEESFRKALAVAPEDAFCWSTIGIVYYSENKFDDAVNALTKSLAINPKNPTAHNYLGITAAQKGWLEAAQKELETAIQLDPKYADAWFNLAVTQTLKQPPDKEQARKAYTKAIELGADKDPAMEQMLK